MSYIYFEDIPREERKQIFRRLGKRTRGIRIWTFFLGCVAMTIGRFVSELTFPDRSNLFAEAGTVGLAAGAFMAIMYKAILLPQVIRLIEREKNS